MFIKKILLDTLNYGVENKTKIFNSLKYPGLGIVITSLFGKNDSDTITIQDILFLVINVYFYVIFAINSHRLVLEKKLPNGIIDTLKWNKRNTSFLLSTFALAISLTVCTTPIVLISLTLFGNVDTNPMSFNIVTILLLLPIGYVFARFSLILPATAIDLDNSWSTAWYISRGHGWSMCFLVSIFPLLTGFVIDSISSTSIFVKLLISMLSVIVLFYEISILSYSYRALCIKANATQQGAVDGLA